jgi:hypothetical protein
MLPKAKLLYRHATPSFSFMLLTKNYHVSSIKEALIFF